MKVSELEVGMLLKFKKPYTYSFLRDSGSDYWLDLNLTVHSPRAIPLMIYLGQKKMTDPSYYGGHFNIREVSIDGKVGWMWSENWRHVEPV